MRSFALLLVLVLAFGVPLQSFASAAMDPCNEAMQGDESMPQRDHPEQGRQQDQKAHGCAACCTGAAMSDPQHAMPAVACADSISSRAATPFSGTPAVPLDRPPQ